MTFDLIKGVVKDYCLLSSTEADTRIGKAVNRHYRRVTSLLGLNATRFVTRNADTTNGVATVTFTEIEKIDRILDTTDSDAIRLLQETSIHEIRATQPGTGDPVRWALQTTDADSVTIRLDTLPQSTYSLQADGWTTLSDLTSSDEPVFPESFHDILAWYVIAEELLKKEKDKLAREYERKADKLLEELRFHLADSPTYNTRQGGGSVANAGGSSGGGGSVGGTAYTQTALITFDRDPSAPFAVSSGSAVVENLDADKLDGKDWDSAITFGGIANTGLKVLDTNASHALSIVPGSDLSAARTLTITTGDAARTITLSGNPTLADWFDQNVKSSATVTFSAVILSGGQVAFPASQNASADANVLDDYEEGTWTPVITFSTPGDLSVAYSVQAGTYTKIGRQVTLVASLTTSTFTHSTAAGSLQITGNPFTANASPGEYVGAVSWQGITKANYTEWKPRLNGATATIDFVGSGSGQSRAALAPADMPTGGTVVLHVVLTLFV